MQINMLDAKSQLSKLVKAALAGEDVIIANRGVAAVRLVPVAAAPTGRRPGRWSELEMSEAALADAFSPATEAIVAEMFNDSPGLDRTASKLSNKPQSTRSRQRK